MLEYMTVLAIFFVNLLSTIEAVSTTISPDPLALCDYSVNSDTASATISGPSRGDYPIYSCTPCARADFEVHILSMYRPHDADRRFLLPPYEADVPVILKADTPTDIKLMLTSYEVAHWVITKPANVNIREIVMYSYNINKTKVRIEGSDTLPNISKYHQYVSFSSAWELKNLVRPKFGFLSSFTGVRETYSWRLTVGECTSEPVNLTALMLMQTTTTMASTTTTPSTENPTTIGTLSLEAFICIIIAIVVAIMIIIAICAFCRKRATSKSPTRYSLAQAQSEPMAKVPSPESEQPSTPLTQQGRDEAEGPPPYEEAIE